MAAGVTVLLDKETRLAVVAALDAMQQKSGKLDAGALGHDAEYGEGRPARQSPCQPSLVRRVAGADFLIDPGPFSLPLPCSLFPFWSKKKGHPKVAVDLLLEPDRGCSPDRNN